MSTNNLTNFQQYLPPHLIENAVSLEEIGISEYAWKWYDVLKVIDILVANKILILGGDVYLWQDGKLGPTGDNWYINRAGYVTTDHDLHNAKNISDNYVKKYMEKHGESYYYSIVASFPHK